MAEPPGRGTAFHVDSAGVSLAGEVEGEDGPSIVLLHGLTATRRYVVHGSRHLPRNGFRLVSYDARGHGESDAAPEGSYTYALLADDAAAVLDRRGGGGTVIAAGHSMGAHTIAELALRDPDRLAGVVLIGPAELGTAPQDDILAYWDRLANGLEQDGVDGFLAAYDQGLDPAWRDILLRIARQRLGAHRHPEGVVRALREVPRTRPFDGVGELGFLDVPALVVASHDEADSAHPYAVAEAWAEALPQGRLVSEDQGQSPLAWQGGRLSRVVEEFCGSGPVRERLGF